ncbi:MAG: lipase [Spirochaetales bacterium]|nr:MAG: lipase [Spirochaetales bacterium]
MFDTLLSMHSVSKQYAGVRALDEVDFDIVSGEIHCLAGENGSGKSTLIKIISGVISPEDGARIKFRGQPVNTHQTNSAHSMDRGVQVIYQDLSLFPNMTVRENIALNQINQDASKLVFKRHETEIAEKAMAHIGVSLPLNELVENLSVGDQQLTAICRALTSDISLLIMDEPTTALTRKEVHALFDVVNGLKEQGIASLFVSHKLDEVFAISERVTVLRNGRKVGTYPAKELDSHKLTELMTGETLEYSPFLFEKTIQEPLMEISNLHNSGNFSNISFKLYPGEILGITGLLGSGRTELAEAIFGIQPAQKGSISISGKQVCIRKVPDAVKHGIAYVPENRLVQGLAMPQSVRNNIISSTIRKLAGKWGLLEQTHLNSESEHWVKELDIKVPSISAAVKTLSGGNQQRVVLGKWIATRPRILILDGPTVGIDVAAKAAIHKIIRDLAEAGMGIIIISDEVAEVYGACNRIFVMHRGQLTHEFLPSETTIETIQSAIETTSQGY